MAKIFLVEDNDNLREAVAGYLKLDGHEVVEFPRIRGLHEEVKKQSPDLLILDVMLPDGDGFLTAKNLRESHHMPIVFVTAKSTESDRITGFEIGGDDYIVKPFSPKELTLRVKAILRRGGSSTEEKPANLWLLENDELRIDDQAHRLFLNDTEVLLTAAEWKILHYLASHAGSVIERNQLLMGSLEYVGSERTIDTHIKNIRAKLGQPGWLETIRGFGYRFTGAPG